ncbi:putative Outer membrane autotransporter barrel [Xenorhabdus bovienii str. Jollieti]|uniref:Putative Outer membrane autotransporter barrel n=1 Tax=Xenorhabdus bovienii (strain SS-2004) TaxID=406818 RepID=D3V205_XENBS|nr:autotransporter outer membrane beta-barrel domain-containing protein [Xenorhabdus bovienii]CBJ81699.1 putative Outer membrane autotransporter barrel [Xenorhabdus bovienii SS-2004]CDH27592.1 putative Outer membrane autotransporter barrel [Xenorhabdus bovienii str. Jollieti]
MKICKQALMPIAIKLALFFPGVSVNAIAASSCGSSNTTTIISDNEAEPCNLSNGENLTINQSASIDIPQGQTDNSDRYGLKKSAVNVGGNNDVAPVTSIDHIENHGILKGDSGITVTYSGSVGKLLNHGVISGASGGVWVSGHMNTLDNYGVIKAENIDTALYSVMLSQALNQKNGSQGSIDTIFNREGGSIDGISVRMAKLNTLDNHGTLTSQVNFAGSTGGTLIVDSGGHVGTFNNYGSVTGPNHGIVITGGGYLENVNNQAGSKGIMTGQDAIQVTGQDTSDSQKKSSNIKQITNASFIRGKHNGISIDDKGTVDTITNLDGGVIQGDKFSINNKGTLINGIDNAGTIDGDVELGSASLYMSGPNAILKGNVSGTKDSVVTIGSKDAMTKNLNLSFTHNMNAGAVRILSENALTLGDGHTTGSIFSDINNEGRLNFNHSDKTTYSHIISGTGSVHQVGSGTTLLTGENTYTGETKIDSGTLQLGDNGTTGSIDKTSRVAIGQSGVLAFDHNNNITFSNNISGTGGVEHVGKGMTILSGQNTYVGKTNIKSGTLQFNTRNNGPDTRLVAIGSEGTLALNLNGTNRFDGVISGNGHLGKIGAGTTTLSSNSSDFTGSTGVEEGTLIVDGKLGTAASTFNVKNGSTVNGSGTIGGTATIENGGHLVGKQGDTLTFGHDLILGHGANVGISLGAAETSTSALFNVRGNLTLAGTLNVTNLGGFSAGEYDIFHYGGTLTNNRMTLTGGEPGTLSLDTSRDKKVYLTNTGGMLLNYWDGGDAGKHSNGVVDGGSGVWQVGGRNNWTSKTGWPNASWSNADQFAIFSGTAGKVQVDNGGGQVTVNGMQFGTEGYTLTGAPLLLKNDNTGSAKIRVGTGNQSAAGSTATIESNLTGSATLETTDYGTLVLKGKNDYTGGTKVTQGILQLGDGGTTGSISGDVVTGDKGTLAFNRSNTVTFGGHITGKGNLVQNGGGTTLLTGGNNYTGTTEIQKGTLRQGAKAAFSTVSSYTIGQNGTLDMGGFNTTISALSNNGRVLVGGDNQTVGRMLTVAGDYSGNNGTVSLSTALAADNSKTDKLVVNGSTSGTTQLAIKNVGGTGAKTQEGIKVIDVQGSSDGTFNLVADYHYQGDPAIVAGAYAYRLYKNGTDNSDGNWYLRSSLTRAKPNPEPAQHYQAGVSVYETYGRILQTLNAPESLRDRIGGRQYPLPDIDEFRSAEGKDSTDESTNPTPNGVWGRLTASHGKLSPRVTTSGADATTYNLFRAQIGMDKRFYENNQGSLDGGVFLQYSNIDAKVGSVHGEGDIRAKGYTVGATSTWYSKNQFYLDGLAQVTYFNNDLNSKTASQPLGNNKSALGYALSLEAGQAFDLSPRWSLTPQAQLMFSSVNMNGFHDPFGARIHFNQSKSMKLRVGTTIDYRQKWHDSLSKEEKSTHLYGFININQEVLGRSDLTDVANVGFISGNDRTWGGMGTGGSYSWGNGKYLIHGEISANSSLNNFADSYDMKAKIGIKRAW